MCKGSIKVSYYFPSPFKQVDLPKTISPQLINCLNSGKSALKTLLKSLDLPVKSKIAIPAYVCSDVMSSVESEFLVPVLFDLKDDRTFWTEYNFSKILEENIKAIILVHLHGFIHPDTEQIANFCKKNYICLIHDAAQSYGIDEEKLTESNGIIYSFGPGKSTSAAGGGWIKSKTGIAGLKVIKNSSVFSFENVKAKFFFKSRLFGYRFSRVELIGNSFINVISNSSTGIHNMTQFQKQAASGILASLNEVSVLRKKRYSIIKDKIRDNKNISLAYDDGKGQYFKAVVYVNNNPDKFSDYLSKNEIPFFSLVKKIDPEKLSSEPLNNFKKNARLLFEISTETSIPEKEIERVATVLASY
ncbi:MAG: DegT/DnrJ/EryC1/StrS family aminotransferase [Bacteroidia bacterium]